MACLSPRAGALSHASRRFSEVALQSSTLRREIERFSLVHRPATLRSTVNPALTMASSSPTTGVQAPLLRPFFLPVSFEGCMTWVVVYLLLVQREVQLMGMRRGASRARLRLRCRFRHAPASWGFAVSGSLNPTRSAVMADPSSSASADQGRLPLRTQMRFASTSYSSIPHSSSEEEPGDRTSTGHSGAGSSRWDFEEAQDVPVRDAPAFPTICDACRTIGLTDTDGAPLARWDVVSLKKAYRQLAALHHPDVGGDGDGTALSMESINAAYECLRRLTTDEKADFARWLITTGGTSCEMEGEDTAPVRTAGEDMLQLWVACFYTSLTALAVWWGGVRFFSERLTGGGAATSTEKARDRSEHILGFPVRRLDGRVVWRRASEMCDVGWAVLLYDIAVRVTVAVALTLAAYINVAFVRSLT